MHNSVTSLGEAAHHKAPECIEKSQREIRIEWFLLNKYHFLHFPNKWQQMARIWGGYAGMRWGTWVEKRKFFQNGCTQRFELPGRGPPLAFFKSKVKRHSDSYAVLQQRHSQFAFSPTWFLFEAWESTHTSNCLQSLVNKSQNNSVKVILNYFHRPFLPLLVYFFDTGIGAPGHCKE